MRNPLPAMPSMKIDSRERWARWAAHLVTIARATYPAAWQRCKFDVLLLAAGLLNYVREKKKNSVGIEGDVV